MKVSEIIQRVQSLYSKGVHSNDTRLTSRHIYNKLLSVRSVMLLKKINSGDLISSFNYQILPCIELIKASKQECACITDINCKVSRSKYKIPKIILSSKNYMISSVTSLEGSINYSLTTWEALKYKQGQKYTMKKQDFYLRDEYLFTTSLFKHTAKIITMTGLFENPYEASQYPSFCEETEECNDCNSPLDLEFPISNDLIDDIIKISTEELVFQFAQMQEDKMNNSKDDNNIKQKEKKK